MLFSLPLAIAGYAAIANITSPVAKYGMTFLMATGMYASVPCILVWNSNNSSGHYKRATTSGMQLAIANCGGFVSSAFTICFKNKANCQLLYTPTRTSRSITGATLLSWACWCLRGLCMYHRVDCTSINTNVPGFFSMSCTAPRSTGTSAMASTTSMKGTMTIAIQSS